MTVREGGCSCGPVRYRLASNPMFVHCCHCLNCQRQTGSAFVINVLIEPDVNIFTRSNLDWVTLPESAPAFEAYHRTKSLWPAKSLERHHAVLPKR